MDQAVLTIVTLWDPEYDGRSSFGISNAGSNHKATRIVGSKRRTRVNEAVGRDCQDSALFCGPHARSARLGSMDCVTLTSNEQRLEPI